MREDSHSVPVELLVRHKDGRVHRVDHQPDETLLEAMLRAGIDAPYSCTQGECATCMVRKLQGEVELLQNHVLSDQDLARGYTLACQGVPRGPICEIEL